MSESRFTKFKDQGLQKKGFWGILKSQSTGHMCGFGRCLGEGSIYIYIYMVPQGPGSKPGFWRGVAYIYIYIYTCICIYAYTCTCTYKLVASFLVSYPRESIRFATKSSAQRVPPHSRALADRTVPECVVVTTRSRVFTTGLGGTVLGHVRALPRTAPPHSSPHDSINHTVCKNLSNLAEPKVNGSGATAPGARGRRPA